VPGPAGGSAGGIVRGAQCTGRGSGDATPGGRRGEPGDHGRDARGLRALEQAVQPAGGAARGLRGSGQRARRRCPAAACRRRDGDRASLLPPRGALRAAPAAGRRQARADRQAHDGARGAAPTAAGVRRGGGGRGSDAGITLPREIGEERAGDAEGAEARPPGAGGTKVPAQQGAERRCDQDRRHFQGHAHAALLRVRQGAGRCEGGNGESRRVPKGGQDRACLRVRNLPGQLLRIPQTDLPAP